MNPDTAHVIDASIPTGLNEDDNATLLQSLFLNDVQQMQAIRRNAYAVSMGQPVPPGGAGVSGISVVHNHTYSPPPPVQQPQSPTQPATLATKLLAGGAIALASGLAGAGGLAYFRPSAPSSTTTTLTNPAPIVTPVIQPPPKVDDSGYNLKVE